MREPETGGTACWMDDGVDTGLIEIQDGCHILPGENASAVWMWPLAPMGIQLLLKTVARSARGKRRALPQTDSPMGTGINKRLHG